MKYSELLLGQGYTVGPLEDLTGYSWYTTDMVATGPYFHRDNEHTREEAARELIISCLKDRTMGVAHAREVQLP